VDRDDAVQLPPARARGKVKEGIRAAGGTPMELNTIAISDGITMGTAGMKASLVSREVIADSIELVATRPLFDAVIALSGCDKTIPGTVMALCAPRRPRRDALRRLDPARPLPGARRHDPGRLRGVGAHAAGQDDRRRAAELEDVASPGAGACGGQFTANTMAMAFEMLGISPIGDSMVPAQEPTKPAVARGRARS
jgi:dihydroxy-acid dehydratase